MTVERSTTENREAWLIKAAEAMAPWFTELDLEVPPVRVSVGWPGGRASKASVVGQCWPTGATDDGVAQIFLSPIRGKESTVDILGTLLHEMIHAVDDCKNSHNKGFIDIARPLGFKARWTSSDNRTETLQERLKALVETLGEFPSGAILAGQRAADGPAKQGTRMLKIVCVEDPDYKLRMTRKQIEDVGLPICPCHHEEMEEAAA